MNFNQIIKEEWEKEFPNKEDSALYFDESIFYHVFGKLVDKICTRVWNEAVQSCIENVETKDIHPEGGYLSHMVINEQSILKLKIDEQGTHTTEV